MAESLHRDYSTTGLKMAHTLCLGVGNTLLKDEGAGVHAMHHLCSLRDWTDDVRFLDAGTLSFTLADDIADADSLLIFDAAQLGAEPGAVRVFEADAFDEFLVSGKRSVHEVGFADLMDIARLQDSLPANRALIGIQPADLGWGEQPGDAVAEALPRAARLAMDILDRWSAKTPAKVVNQ
jgi:hydrogenase maturation protease